MKNRKALAISSIFVGLLASSAQAYDVNKDLRNLGPAAHDVAVVLAGAETVTGHYDGYPSGHFSSFAQGPSGANWLLRWQNFWDGVDNKIDNNQLIHIGWTTADHSSSIIDMYWTNQFGKRIPGSIVYNITSGWTYETSVRNCAAIWDHNFATRSPISISNIRFALNSRPYPLEDLNAQNSMLMRALRPLRKGFALQPGRQISLPIPESHGMSVVLVYEVRAPGSAALSRDFIQFQCVDRSAE